MGQVWSGRASLLRYVWPRRGRVQSNHCRPPDRLTASPRATSTAYRATCRFHSTARKGRHTHEGPVCARGARARQHRHRRRRGRARPRGQASRATAAARPAAVSDARADRAAAVAGAGAGPGARLAAHRRHDHRRRLRPSRAPGRRQLVRGREPRFRAGRAGLPPLHDHPAHDQGPRVQRDPHALLRRAGAAQPGRARAPRGQPAAAR